MKFTYIISYDVLDANSADSYQPLYEKIKSYKIWAHITESTWAIISEDSAEIIRDNLLSTLEEKCRIIVIKSGNEGAWKNVICSNEWLKKNL